MNSNSTISETPKLPTFSGNHAFSKGIHESLKKTTLALKFLFVCGILMNGQNAMAQLITPAMPESDRNIVQRADGSGGMIKGANGVWYAWGLGAYFVGHPDFSKYFVGLVSSPGAYTYPVADLDKKGYAEFLEPITPANGFPYTGNILKVAITNSGWATGSYDVVPSGSVNRVLLTDDNKLWLIPFGDLGGNNMGITVNPTAAVNTVREAKLPVGITASQVSFMDGTTTAANAGHFLYLIANGELYIAGTFQGQQGSATAVLDANGWQKVMIDATTPLSNLVMVSEQSGSMFAALTSNNEVYMVGGGWKNAQTCTNNTRCKRLLPSGATYRDFYANLALTPPVSLANVYPSDWGFGLTGRGNDGKIYRLGEISYGPKFTRPIYTTFQINGKTLSDGTTIYPFNISTNPKRWQYAEFDEKSNQPWQGYNSTWKPEYFLDGEELTGVKFYRYTVNGGMALRDHEDYKYLYHANGQSSFNDLGHTLGGYVLDGYTAPHGNLHWAPITSWTMLGGGDRRLAYITPITTRGADQPNVEMFTRWGLSYDGKVCAYNLHQQTPWSAWNLIQMGMFDRKINSWNSNDNNTWRCGTPKTADGSTFVAAGAITITPVAGPAGAGTIDCAKTQISPAPVFGTASQLSLIVTVNVTTVGSFPVTVTGSGFTLANGVSSVTATATGVQTFVIPLKYDGTTALGVLDFTIGTANACTADLAPVNNTRQVNVNIWTLDNCTAKPVAPKLK